MTPRLIIFDCDGVLVDSELLAMRVLLSAIKAQGVDIGPEEAYRSHLGRSLAAISSSLHDSHGVPLSATSLQTMRSQLYALYREELRPTPGIKEVLEKLTIPFCVASSSNPERIRVSLEVTGLLHWFEPNIFSASMVENGKPAPDLFLYAARKMGAPPGECLVIEDSPAGITAARAARMHVFAYVGGSHIGPSGLLPTIADLKPDALLDDMHDLPDRIGWLGNSKTAD